MDGPLATLEVLSASAGQEPKGTIAFVTRDQLNAYTFMSYAHSDLKDLPVYRIIIPGSVLTMQRNECVQKMQGDFLLFIDDDMVFESDAIKRLVASYEELKEQTDEPFMVSGLCFRRREPYQPTLYVREQPTSGSYNFMEEWDHGLVEVDATGCAFLLIPKEVFEAISGVPIPTLDMRQKMGGLPNFFRWDKNFGEDLAFCQDAKEAGVHIFVDTRIEIGHVSDIIVTKQHFWQAMATRPNRLYAERLMINKRMNMPTLSPEKARERLGQ